MPKDIHTKLVPTVSHKLSKESFLLKKFFKKMKLKDVASTKTQKTDIFESVLFRGAHYTAESRQGCGSAFILCGSRSFSECRSGSRSRSSLTKFEEKKSWSFLKL